MSYEPAKPIEPGCLVMVLPSPNKGDPSEFVGCVGVVEKERPELAHMWKHPPYFDIPSISNKFSFSHNVLLRIDDPDKAIESEKEKEASA